MDDQLDSEGLNMADLRSCIASRSCGQNNLSVWLRTSAAFTVLLTRVPAIADRKVRLGTNRYALY